MHGVREEHDAPFASLRRTKNCRKCLISSLRTQESEIVEFCKDKQFYLLGIKIREKEPKTCGKFKCKTCGHEWLATFGTIKKGHGCEVCARERNRLNKYLTLDNVKGYAKPYNLEILSIFVGLVGRKQKKRTTFAKCVCKACGRVWSTTANNIKKGQGCPSCCKSGYDVNKPGTFYVYEISNGFIGFGITNVIKSRDRQHRRTFRLHSVSAKLLYTYLGDGEDIFLAEQELKRHLPIESSGIPGFISESVRKDDLGLITTYMEENDKFQRMCPRGF